MQSKVLANVFTLGIFIAHWLLTQSMGPDHTSAADAGTYRPLLVLTQSMGPDHTSAADAGTSTDKFT